MNSFKSQNLQSFKTIPIPGRGGGKIMATYELSDKLENALRAEICYMADN